MSTCVLIDCLADISQVGELQGRAARLQSELERGEVERQRLEYCLAVAQSEARRMEEARDERETKFQALQGQMQGIELACTTVLVQHFAVTLQNLYT